MVFGTSIYSFQPLKYFVSSLGLNDEIDIESDFSVSVLWKNLKHRDTQTFIAYLNQIHQSLIMVFTV